MFKGSKEELDRFLDICHLKKSKNAFLPLSRKRVRLIEESDLLTIGEKLELLLVASGDKLTTEIFQKISYRYSDNQKKEISLYKNVNEIRNLLDQLPFFYFIDKIVKFSKKTKRMRQYTWFQVSVNETVSYLLKKYANQLSSTEWGALYGYPISAIRAFGGLIEQEKRKQSSLIDYFFSGVLSRNFNKGERKYFQCWWQKIKHVSPELARQALLDYRKGN